MTGNIAVAVLRTTETRSVGRDTEGLEPVSPVPFGAISRTAAGWWLMFAWALLGIDADIGDRGCPTCRMVCVRGVVELVVAKSSADPGHWSGSRKAPLSRGTPGLLYCVDA